MRSRLQLETLELRAVPANFDVNTLADTHATDFTLGKDASGEVSLRSALEAVNKQGGSHTINLGTATYFLTLGELPINGSPTKATVTITGDGSANTIIDAKNASRVFQNFAGNTATFVDLAIQHGTNSSQGGGIRNSGTMHAYNSLFNDNHVTAVNSSGGAIWNFMSATFTNCTFAGNSDASHGGAAIQNWDGRSSLTVTNSTFTGNISNGGFDGTIQNDGLATVTGSTFDGNTGSGIYNGIGTLIVSNSTFSNNSEEGVFNHSGSITVSGSLFTGNVRGGIGNVLSSTLTVTGSTFSGNLLGGIDNSAVATIRDSLFANNSGSVAISNTFGELTLTNSTIVGNTRGGLRTSSGTATVVNSTIHANSNTSSGGGISSGPIPQIRSCSCGVTLFYRLML